MPKFRIKSVDISGNRVEISGSDYRHIVKVLRIGKNEYIDLVDETSTQHKARIVSLENNRVRMEILESKKITTESIIEINLFQSIPKSNKMDLIVQKATELGVRTIIPYFSERTVVKETKKHARWKKIAEESCKQCGRALQPEVKTTISFYDIPNFTDQKSNTILFYENSANSFKSDLENRSDSNNIFNLIVGPEGGFNKEEISFAESNNFKISGLGPRILRSETAAIAAISIIQYRFGDL